MKATNSTFIQVKKTMLLSK